MALIQSLLHSESRAPQPSAEQQETEEQARAADPQQGLEGLSAVQVATVDSFQVPFHYSIPLHGRLAHRLLQLLTHIADMPAADLVISR